jgi:hypothetical protein
MTQERVYPEFSAEPIAKSRTESKPSIHAWEFEELIRFSRFKAK